MGDNRATATALVIERIKTSSEVAKNIVSLLRDAAIIALVVALLVNRDAVFNWMAERGVESGSVLGFKFDLKKIDETAALATNVTADAEQATGKSIAAIEKLAREKPALAPELASVLQSLRANRLSAEQANAKVSAAAVSQQEAVARALPAKPAEGWVSSNFLRFEGPVRIDATAIVVPPRPLNLRSAPGIENATLGTLFPGTRVRVTAGPRGTWVRVTTEPGS
jgi:hypothetical protein